MPMNLGRILFHTAPVAAALTLACGDEIMIPTVTIDPAAITTLQADAALQQVQDVAVDESGQYWVLQREESPHVLLYSAEGQLLNAFGMSGPARTQLSRTFWLVPTGDASRPMGVWDVGNSKLALYGPTGNLVMPYAVDRSRRDVYRDIDKESYGRPVDLARFGDGYLLQDHPDGLSRTGDYLRAQLLLLHSDGQRKALLMDFEEEFAAGRDALGEYAELLVPIPLWTTCESGELVLFDPFASRLRWFGPDGGELASDTVPLVTRDLTDDDINSYLFHTFEHRWYKQTTRDLDTAVIERSIEEFMLSHFLELAETRPYTVGIMCGSNRQVWLQQFSVADNPLGYSNGWVVHEPSQTELRRVQFPASFRPLRIAGDRILGAHTDEQGVQTGAWVPIPDLSAAELPPQ
ncbi:MAG: hypothetical protein JSW71_06560 [Gemmatimonadota bacterium]|nr:MAG: hypothetical protein JSW71_06560 [Gemmatimonadota bacterium]